MTDESIEDIIKSSEIHYTEEDIIVKLTEIILYENSKDTDLLLLSKNIGLENTLKVFKILGGKRKKFEKYDFVDNALKLAIIYYYRELYIDINKGKVGLDWKNIQEILPNIQVDNYKTKLTILKKKIASTLSNFTKKEKLKNEY